MTPLPPTVWPDPRALHATAPEPLLWTVGLAGVFLLVWGARLRDRGVVLSTLVGALFTAWWLASLQAPLDLPGSIWIQTGTAAVVAGAAMWVAWLVPRLGLALSGLQIGVVLAAGALGIVLDAPWSVTVVVACAIVWPFAHEPLSWMCVPAIGASALTWSLGDPTGQWGAVLWFLGTIAAVFGQSRERDPAAGQAADRQDSVPVG